MWNFSAISLAYTWLTLNDIISQSALIDPASILTNFPEFGSVGCFQIPYILLKMYVYILVDERIIFCVDFCTRRDMCKTTTIVCSVMNSIDFALRFQWKRKHLPLSDELCTKKVHFLWSFILCAQETFSWKLKSKLSCFTCFASQRYERIPSHNNDVFTSV